MACRLMIVDDDMELADALAQAMGRYGCEGKAVYDGQAALALQGRWKPTHAVIDLNMPGIGGLELVKRLHALDRELNMVVLTGYASVATAVEAIKLGARHYLQKPAKSQQIWDAFQRIEGDSSVMVDDAIPLLKAEQAMIEQALLRNQFNISATARELRMHRRTLQRKLMKMPHWQGIEHARQTLSA